MIQVIVEIVTRPGLRDAYLEAFKANQPTVQAKKGCIEYMAFVDKSAGASPYGPDTIIVSEKWETGVDLKAHAEAPAMAAYQEKLKSLVVSRTVRLLKPA